MDIDKQQILENNMTLVVSDSWGVYIPQVFAQSYGDHPSLHGVSKDDIKTLLSGPDHEHYWETWDEVLGQASFMGLSLHQDGDLWFVNHDGINEACEQAGIDPCEVWDGP